MRPRFRELLWLSFSLVPFYSFASSQDSKNSSFVVVEVGDVTGAEVPNAQIEFVELSTKAQTVCPTNSAGKAMCALAPGAYIATVTFPGFRTATQRIDGKSGETQSVRFVLQVGSCPPGPCIEVTPKTYMHSRAGIEEQFADVLAVVRTGDEAAIRKALDTLGIPNAKEWVMAHFAGKDVAQEDAAYVEGLKKFQSRVWWVTGNFGKNPAFALKVEDSAVARTLSDVGFESLVPRPKDEVKIETFRFSSNVPDPKLGSQSWVSSFIYLDGRFRMVGGTYPFWAEGLNATRGPMSLPPAEIRGRIVQAAAFRNDAKGPGIDGIVHIKVDVGHDGKVKKMKVLSGDAEFVDDAKRYLQDGEFPKLPNDPRLANAKLEWDMEVVFFARKQAAGARQ